MRPRHSSRAMSLIGILLVASLLITLAFTTAAMSFSHFTLSQQMDKAVVARSLAEAAANRAIARCLADVQYGTRREASEDIEVSLASAPDGWGKVYFGGHDSISFGGIPKSSNCLAQDVPQQGTGRVIPSRSLHVIAVGEYNKTRRAVETIVSIPLYKYAISTTGNVTSQGGLLVAGVKNPAAVENGVSLIPDDQWSPGCMMSNSGDVQEAINLDSGTAATRVTGDVRSVGGIKLGPNTTVEGSLQAFASSEEVPQVTATDYDTAGMTGCNTSLGGSEFALEIVGPARRSGNLTVTGGMTMDAGVLYVDGDVEIHGGLRGKGALISTGKVKIYNQSSFKAADDQAAIVASSDVEIRGSNKDDCVYNGVVFTQGDFKANKVTLLGALCASKTAGSKVELEEANVLSNPISMDLEYVVEGMLPDHVAAARRYFCFGGPGGSPANGFTLPTDDTTRDGKMINPKTTPPAGQDLNLDGRPDFDGDANIGLATDRYALSNNPIMSFATSESYDQSVQSVLGRSDTRQDYNLLLGNPEYCRYNSDYTKAWDAAANEGEGAFTLEKFAEANPLGMMDGNAKMHLNDIVFDGQPGWSFSDSFSSRKLYQAIRGQQTSDEPLQTYRLVNKTTGETRQVTFAEVFNPGGSQTPAEWGAASAASFMGGILGPNQSQFQGQYFDWIATVPAPMEPWNDPRFLKVLNDPKENFSERNGALPIYNWLTSRTSFNKVPTKRGSFRFNPMQFIQLRDQSQRLLWREYDPGKDS
ncbi:MAG: hypothetical protein J0I12_17545 [Candidatus Eremiobacteraeota bacterium]|nr:hypothetical protein [Candidatus Eremiobacteraeota bacterium]